MVENYACDGKPTPKRLSSYERLQGLVDCPQHVARDDDQRIAELLDQIGHVKPLFAQRGHQAAGPFNQDDLRPSAPASIQDRPAQQLGEIELPAFGTGS